VTPSQSTDERAFELPRYQRLGEMLIERKKIEAEDLERALELQRGCVRHQPEMENVDDHEAAVSSQPSAIRLRYRSPCSP